MKTKAMRRKHFTLIEMLVVIAIIAILAAMMAPSLMTARARAMEAACLNNLKQMGAATMLYTEEYRFYPNQRWNYQLGAYADAQGSTVPGIFRCMGVPYDRTNGGGLLAITYGMPGVYYNCTQWGEYIGFGNPALTWSGQPEYYIRASAVRAPSQKAVMVEWWDDSQTGNLEMGSSSLNDRNVMYVHDKRSNLAFADGRAVASGWDFAGEFKAPKDLPGGRYAGARCATTPSVNIFLPKSTAPWR